LARCPECNSYLHVSWYRNPRTLQCKDCGAKLELVREDAINKIGLALIAGLLIPLLIFVIPNAFIVALITVLVGMIYLNIVTKYKNISRLSEIDEVTKGEGDPGGD